MAVETHHFQRFSACQGQPHYHCPTWIEYGDCPNQTASRDWKLSPVLISHHRHPQYVHLCGWSLLHAGWEKMETLQVILVVDVPVPSPGKLCMPFLPPRSAFVALRVPVDAYFLQVVLQLPSDEGY